MALQVPCVMATMAVAACEQTTLSAQGRDRLNPGPA